MWFTYRGTHIFFQGSLMKLLPLFYGLIIMSSIVFSVIEDQVYDSDISDFILGQTPQATQLSVSKAVPVSTTYRLTAKTLTAAQLAPQK